MVSPFGGLPGSSLFKTPIGEGLFVRSGGAGRHRAPQASGNEKEGDHGIPVFVGFLELGLRIPHKFEKPLLRE